MAGRVIPEPVFDKKSYEEQIFQRIYADIAPHDPQGILQHEWLNSRGAIARFDRNAIEIRGGAAAPSTLRSRRRWLSIWVAQP